MAEDLTKGLHILLHPKFTEVTQRLDKLNSWCKDLQHAVGLKEDRVEVDHLREHVEGQIKHVENIINIQKENHARLDDLRTQQIRALNLSVEQKADKGTVTQLADQVQAVNATVVKKAEISKVDQLEQQLKVLSEDVSLKATAARAEHLAAQLQALGDQVAEKVDNAAAEGLNEKLKALAEKVAQKSTNAKAEDLSRQLQALGEECAQKAETSRVDQLARSMQALCEDVSKRSEGTVTEHLSRQLQTLGDKVNQKADAATMDHTLTHVNAVSDACSKKAELGQHNLVSDQVDKLREELFAYKAGLDRVDDLSQRVDVMSNSLQLESAKVKNLSLLCAGVGVRPSTAPTTAPTSPLTNVTPSPHRDSRDTPGGMSSPTLRGPANLPPISAR